MTIRDCIAGSEISESIYSNGLGSIFLAGPNTGWVNKFRSYCSKRKVTLTLFISDRKPEHYLWEREAMALSTCIVFWFPKNYTNRHDYVDFGRWLTTERIFLGIEESKDNEYLEWLMFHEHQLYPARTVEELAEMTIHWMLE